jgi:uncharacterized protein (TIGR02001 family)
MRNTKISLFVILLNTLFVLPVHAVEDSEASDSTITYNLGLTSDYIFRGITQTTHAPAIQGELTYIDGNGVYLGAWGSNVKRNKDLGAIASGDAAIELDTYFGIRNELFKDTGFDLGFIRYNYLGAYTPQSGYDRADTAEVYASAYYKYVTLKYSYSLLDSFMAIRSAKGTNYIDLSANFPVADVVTFGVHVGKQTFVVAEPTAYMLAGYSPSYTDFKLSATSDIGGYIVSLAYTNTNATAFWAPGGDQWGSAAYVMSLNHLF